MLDTLIIGGGMGGLGAAVAAAQAGEAVALLERNPKILKKLGVTGNGRGNLLNQGTPLYYGDEAFAKVVLSHWPYERLAGFWEGLGVPLRLEGEGRVYPAALQASVAVDALALRAEQLGVQVFLRTRAHQVRQKEGCFWVEAEELPAPDKGSAAGKGKASKPAAPQEPRARTFRTRRVIVAVGGAAAPAQGTDGTGYGLLTAFGHTLAEPRPALCALRTEKGPLSGLEGQRVRATLALEGLEGAMLGQSQGEALFAADGVSGIAAMQLARWVQPGCRLHMDLRGELNRAELPPEALTAYLQNIGQQREKLPLNRLFTGMLTWPLARAVLAGVGYSRQEYSSMPIEALAPRDYQALARQLADFSLEVLGPRGFDSAQVTAGGILCGQFNPATMESLLQKGLYAVGEVLNVDGDCGGFNLMFALASGLTAGEG